MGVSVSGSSCSIGLPSVSVIVRFAMVCGLLAVSPSNACAKRRLAALGKPTPVFHCPALPLASTARTRQSYSLLPKLWVGANEVPITRSSQHTFEPSGNPGGAELTSTSYFAAPGTAPQL